MSLSCSNWGRNKNPCDFNDCALPGTKGTFGAPLYATGNCPQEREALFLSLCPLFCGIEKNGEQKEVRSDSAGVDWRAYSAMGTQKNSRTGRKTLRTDKQSDKTALAMIRRVLPRGEFLESKKVYNGAGVKAGDKAGIKAGV